MSIIFSSAIIDQTFSTRSTVRLSTISDIDTDTAATWAYSATAPGTLTDQGQNVTSIDGQSVALGDRILVRSQSVAAENGVYEVTVLGVPTTAATVLTRASDQPAAADISGLIMFVEQGTQGNTGWIGSGEIDLSATYSRFDAQGLVDDEGNLDAPTVSGDLTVTGNLIFDRANDLTINPDNQTGAAAVLTIPDLGASGADTMVLEDAAQTLTTKTIDADVNTITNIGDDELKAGIDAAKLADGSVSNIEFQYINSLTSNAQTQLDARVVGPETATDNAIARYDLATGELIQDSGVLIDDSNNLSGIVNITLSGTVDGVDVSAHAAASSGVHGVTGDVVGTTDAQTLTNKTLTSAVLTTPQINDTSLDHQYVFVPSELAADRNVTLPLLAADDTFVFEAHAQTLTNKTLSTGTDIEVHNTAFTDAGDDTLTIAFNGTGNTITFPNESGTVATQSYVDGVAQGLDVKDSVKLGSTVDLDSNASISGTATYNSTGGTSTRGQITATLASSDVFTVDGVSLGSAENGTRILLKNQSTGASNGIWVTTISGTSLTLDRATDFDEDSEVTASAFTFIEEGSTLADSGWVLTTNDTITIGGGSGTSLSFSQFSAAGLINAGNGLTKTGDTINVVGTAGRITVDATTVDIASTYVGQISITTLGTIATGTWQADDVAVAHGGTGVSTLTAGNVLVGDGANAVQTTKAAPTGDFIGTSDTQTMTNKTLTSPIISTISNTGTLTLPTSTDTLVGRDTTDTLTNKTLTSPKIGTAILDTNGFELLNLTATASAFNYMTLANAATGDSPVLSATGGDNNVSLAFQAKGTGNYEFLATEEVETTLKLYEDVTNGSNYMSLKAPAALADDTTVFCLPASNGTSSYLLSTDGSGNTSWVDPGTVGATVIRNFVLLPLQVEVKTSGYIDVAYFAWDNSEYGDANTTNTTPLSDATLHFWFEDMPSNRGLNMRISEDDGTSDTQIDVVTIPQGTADGIGISTGVTLKQALNELDGHRKLRIQVEKSSSGGDSNPKIFGIHLTLKY